MVLRLFCLLAGVLHTAHFIEGLPANQPSTPREDKATVNPLEVLKDKQLTNYVHDLADRVTQAAHAAQDWIKNDPFIKARMMQFKNRIEESSKKTMNY